jgi:hypothetical protein
MMRTLSSVASSVVINCDSCRSIAFLDTVRLLLIVAESVRQAQSLHLVLESLYTPVKLRRNDVLCAPIS